MPSALEMLGLGIRVRSNPTPKPVESRDVKHSDKTSKPRSKVTRDRFETTPSRRRRTRSTADARIANNNGRGALGALSAAQNLHNASAASLYGALKWSAKASDVQGPKTMPSKKAFSAAVNAYNKAKQKGYVRKQKMTIVDYSKPSNKPRLWVIDMKTNSIQAQTLVTHGVGSGKGATASSFSNKSGSNKTSLGTYIVGRQYSGKFGKATFVRGLERGMNDQANNRTIRIHQYDNVMNNSYNSRYPSHSVSTTEGCFGISNGKMLVRRDGKNVEEKVGIDYGSSIINMVKNGSVLVAYHPSVVGKSSYMQWRFAFANSLKIKQTGIRLDEFYTF